MKKNNHARLFSMLAAICILAVCTLTLPRIVTYVDFIEILPVLFLSGLAVPLFLKAKLPTLITASVYALYVLYETVISFIRLLNYRRSYNVFPFLANAFALLAVGALMILILLAMLRVRAVRFMWFLPGALYSFALIFALVEPEYHSIYLPLLKGLNLLAAMIMAGLWLKEEITLTAERPATQPVNGAPAPGYAAPPQNAYAQGPAYAPAPNAYAQVNNAHFRDSDPYGDDVVRLRRFKSLLDEGVITQEEFEAKKKEILGL